MQLQTQRSGSSGDAFSPGEHPHLFQTWKPEDKTKPDKRKSHMKIRIAHIITAFAVLTLLPRIHAQTCGRSAGPLCAPPL
jgi:hypothetical protein